MFHKFFKSFPKIRNRAGPAGQKPAGAQHYLWGPYLPGGMDGKDGNVSGNFRGNFSGKVKFGDFSKISGNVQKFQDISKISWTFRKFIIIGFSSFGRPFTFLDTP